MLDLFKDLPCRDVMLRVRGRELPGTHGVRIAKKLANEPESFHKEALMKKQMTLLSHQHTHKPKRHLVVPDPEYFEGRPSSGEQVIKIEMTEHSYKPPSRPHPASTKNRGSQLSAKSS